MPSAIQPSSSAHSRPMVSRGIKRPRRSDHNVVPSAATAPSTTNTNGPEPSVGPRDIKTTAAQLTPNTLDNGNYYSATPPTHVTKRSTIRRSDSSSPAPSAPAPAPMPVKSALASSSRLAAGPPGAAGDRYKRSMYTAFVDSAFAEREKGASKSYWDLVSQFRSSAISINAPSSTHSLSLWLLALSHHVSKLDAASHSQLVENILDLPWAGASDDFVRSWSRFVCALVSARLEWAPSVLGRTVKAMRWRSDWLPLQPINPPSPPAEASQSAQDAQPTRRKLYTRIHLLLRAILTLIPTLPSTLGHLLVKHFPHKREGKREHAAYVRNILFVTRYEPQVAEAVWRIVADRAIGLDVEIQIEIDELEEENEDGGDEGTDAADIDLFDRAIDDEEDDEDDDDDDSSDDEGSVGFSDVSDDDEGPADDSDDMGINDAMLRAAEEERRERKVRDLVGKLDAIMKVCFEHLDTIGTFRGRRRATGGLALDTRPSWLAEFLGTGGSSGPARDSTPTLSRTNSQASLRAKVAAGTEPREASPSASQASDQTAEEDKDDLEAFESSREALFHQLLHLFSRLILPTFKCRHVQFLLFWYCSLDSDFADFFLGFLIHKAIYAGALHEEVASSTSGSANAADRGRSRAEPIVLRQASASYVASFVSRAKYITPSYTRTVVYNLCSYLEAHLEAHSNALALATSVGTSRLDERTRRLALAAPGNEEHAIFYAVAQAVFYIFCFRWQDLQTDRPGALTGEEVLARGRRDDDGDESRRDEAEESDIDAGLMIGSLSSTGSSSYALPSSFHRHASSHANATTSGKPGDSATPAINIDFDGGEAAVDPPATKSDWSPGLSVLQRAILSPLNPLQYCSPTVVRQFASVAQHVGFLYCWSVIEANRRNGSGFAAATSGGASTGGGVTGGAGGGAAFLTKDLEGFFPFDPYRLQSTAERFVQPQYREWRDVAPRGMGGDDDDDDDDDDDEEEEDDDEDEDEDEEDTAAATGLEIPARKGQQQPHPRRGTSSSLLSPSDASAPSPASGLGFGAGAQEEDFAKSMEAMSVSAS